MEALCKEALDCYNILVNLKLHSAELKSIVAEKQTEPQFWHITTN